MRDDDKYTKKAWAYVHGELSEQDRAEIESESLADEALRSAIAEARAMDVEIRKTMPMTVWSEQELAESILRAWESADAELELEKQLIEEYDREHPEQGELEINTVSIIEHETAQHRPLLYGPFGVVLSLAASLLIIFMVGIRNQNASSLDWASPEIVQAASYRGADGTEVPSKYSREQMSNFSAMLRAAVQESYDRSAPKSAKKSIFGNKSDWVMSARFQELRQGKLGVQVKAYSAGGKEPAKEWNKYFTDSSVFREQVDNYGSEIATALATFGAREQGGS